MTGHVWQPPATMVTVIEFPHWAGMHGSVLMAKRRPKKTTAVPEAPTCNCLLLCDDVILSQGKNKHFLQGIIGIIGVRELPATVGGFVAYIRISNVYGSPQITINLINAASDEAILELRVPLPEGNDPLGVYTLVVPIPPFQVRESGRYMFNAICGGIPIAQSPIMIVTPPSSGE